jgi:hypothetical protein
MRIFFSLLAVAICGVIATPSSAESFADHGTVTAKRAGGKVTIVVAGKGEWSVNAEYNIKVELGSAVLRKSDASYEGLKDGKAKAARFETSDAASSGTVKAVFCNPSSCTSPLTTNFDVK